MPCTIVIFPQTIKLLVEYMVIIMWQSQVENMQYSILIGLIKLDLLLVYFTISEPNLVHF